MVIMNKEHRRHHLSPKSERTALILAMEMEIKHNQKALYKRNRYTSHITKVLMVRTKLLVMPLTEN